MAKSFKIPTPGVTTKTTKKNPVSVRRPSIPPATITDEGTPIYDAIRNERRYRKG